METIYYIADLLGWTALHAIWQVALIGLLLKVLTQFIPEKEYDLRLALFGGAIALTFISTLSTLLYLIDLRAPMQEVIYKWPEAYYMYSPLMDSGQSQNMWAWFGQYSHWMGVFWLCGTLSLGIYWAGGYFLLKRMQRKATKLDGKYFNKLKSWSLEMGIDKTPDLRMSAQIASPVLTGFLQPIILLPTGMLQAFSDEQIECILRHEWLHWKRHDHLINLVLAVFESIFFFHPLCWWLTKEVRHLQELIVDRETVKHTQEPIRYAKTLYEVQKLALQTSVGMTAFSAGKGNLLHRIEQVLSPYPHSKNKIMKTHNIGIVFLSGIFISLISLAAYSMEAPEDSKEISVKTQNSAEQIATADVQNEIKHLAFLPTIYEKDPIHSQKNETLEIKRPAVKTNNLKKKEYNSPDAQDNAFHRLLSLYSQDTLPESTIGTEEEWEEFEKKMEEFALKMGQWSAEFAQKVQAHMPPQDSLQKMISELQRTMQEEQWTEEEMEVFERKMEAYSQRMEEWGERFEHMMERWAEKYEQEMERMGEEMDSIEKPPLPPPPPPPPLPEAPEEPKGEE